MEALNNAWHGSRRLLTYLTRTFQVCICALLMWPPFFSGHSYIDMTRVMTMSALWKVHFSSMAYVAMCETHRKTVRLVPDQPKTVWWTASVRLQSLYISCGYDGLWWPLEALSKSLNLGACPQTQLLANYMCTNLHFHVPSPEEDSSLSWNNETKVYLSHSAVYS